MIAVEKALQLINDSIKHTDLLTMKPISKAQGYVLAKDVVCHMNMPPFRQSAMDGYALGSIDDKRYKLIGEVKAGDDDDPKLGKGEAIRIFTGAPVPSGAKAVIMQEKVNVKNDEVIIEENIKENSNIRPIGEQVHNGDVALFKGTVLTPSGVGYLASLGITHVEVYKKPSIAIITTGNELVPPGQKLKHGQIYESNSIMLSAALSESGFSDVSFYKVEDDYELTYSLIENALEHYEIVILTGGISVGDYDFVGKALNALDVDEVFYKVKQKPGKPLYFGKKNDTTVFALPGNPASALSCFYIYVLPSLFKISGHSSFHLKRSLETSSSKYIKKGQRSEFLKAILDENGVKILDGQASSMLRSFALANTLVYLPEEKTEVNINDKVQVIHLP